MSLDNTATSEENIETDLVEKSVERNKKAALRFARFAKSDINEAKKYFDSLTAETQDYVRYAEPSHEHYNRLINGNNRHVRNL